MNNPQTEKRRLFLDMDGTLAKFHDQVNYLERMFEKDFFRDLEPFENMVEGVRQFIQEHPDVEVFILSARILGEPPYCEAEKNEWLDRYLPEIDQAHRIYTDTGKSKAEYVPGGVGKNDFLVDDYNKGLNLWLYDGGSAIKCHNNINQRGLGAYGGSAGRLWTGDMVHTEDAPAMIAAELAQHMGLEFDLNKVVTAYKEISYTPETAENRYKINPLVPVHTYRLMEKSSQAETYKATYFDQETLRVTSEEFSNPLNAIRWLNGNDSFRELHLRDLEGKEFSIPKFLANDAALNHFGYYAHQMYAWDQIPPHIADSFKQEIENSKLPIVGQVHYLGSNGIGGNSAIFHSVEEMKAEIQDCQDCGRPITADWFVNPNPPAKLITLETYSEPGPSAFMISPDNLRMAAEFCGFSIDSIEDFLSEYTWDDSILIWEQYAQYINKVANVMDGFASREEVEEEFYELMCDVADSPIDAAKSMLGNITQWARWDNEDALKAGVLDKAMALREALLESLEPSSEVPTAPLKPALDSIISAAKEQQGNKGKLSLPHNNER